MDEIPHRLFKFLPSRYLKDVYDHGHLLFRNLSHFRQIEVSARGDPEEGVHRDQPKNLVTLENLTTGRKIIGNFSYLRSLNSDKTYIFCMSIKFESRLFVEFESDACIEIHNPSNFIDRVKHAQKRMLHIEKGVLNGPVEYYEKHVPPERDITDNRNLAFFKSPIYRHQSEYRLAFSSKGGLKQTQRIVMNDGFTYDEEISKAVSKSRILGIGSLREIANVVWRA